MKNDIKISEGMLKMNDDWETIKKHIVRVPKEVSDACDQSVLEAMKEGDEKIRQARAEAAARLGVFLID